MLLSPWAVTPRFSLVRGCSNSVWTAVSIFHGRRQPVFPTGRICRIWVTQDRNGPSIFLKGKVEEGTDRPMGTADLEKGNCSRAGRWKCNKARIRRHRKQDKELIWTHGRRVDRISLGNVVLKRATTLGEEAGRVRKCPSHAWKDENNSEWKVRTRDVEPVWVNRAHALQQEERKIPPVLEYLPFSGPAVLVGLSGPHLSFPIPGPADYQKCHNQEGLNMYSTSRWHTHPWMNLPISYCAMSIYVYAHSFHSELYSVKPSLILRSSTSWRHSLEDGCQHLEDKTWRQPAPPKRCFYQMSWRHIQKDRRISANDKLLGQECNW
jgi:hypothetical protein